MIIMKAVTGLICTYAFIYEANILIHQRLLRQHCLSVLSDVWTRDAFELLCCCGLSCRQGNLNTPCLLLSSLTQVVFWSIWAPSSLLWLAQTLHTLTVGHSPCAKGKHGGKVDGRPAALCHTSTGEWVQAIHEVAWKVFHNLLAASEIFAAVNSDLCYSSRHSMLDLYCDLAIKDLTAGLECYSVSVKGPRDHTTL